MLVGMRHGTATLEDSLVVFYKTKQSLPCNSAIALVIYPNELKMISKYFKKSYLHKNLYMDVYSSFIYSCQNLESTEMFFSREWISKLCHIPVTEYHSAIKEMSYQVTKDMEKP